MPQEVQLSPVKPNSSLTGSPHPHSGLGIYMYNRGSTAAAFPGNHDAAAQGTRAAAKALFQASQVPVGWTSMTWTIRAVLDEAAHRSACRTPLDSHR
jgi:hypothetical protein